MSSLGVERFGELLMRKVRDRAITYWGAVLDGRMKSQRRQAAFASLDPAQRDALRRYIPAIVDTTLHFPSCLLEESENEVTVRITIDAQDAGTLTEGSDGLPQELGTEDGWIARFSREPLTD